MRLVFMGSPDFAVESLELLNKSNHHILTVVTAPDKPRGRGRKVSPTPVKVEALKLGLPFLQPKNLKAKDFLESLKDLEPDLNVVVAFRILPEVVFSLPTFGSVNLHASLLPQYRGAAPINWVLIHGETHTGLTTFLLKKRVDTGDILLQREVEITPEDDFGSLYDRMAKEGAKLLLETIDGIEKGSIVSCPQNQKGATIAPKLTPETGLINWNLPAEKILNLIRGLSPVPGAYSFTCDKKIIFLKAALVKKDITADVGSVIDSDPKKGFIVACGQKALEVLVLKPQGRRVMGSAEYVRGYHVKIGDRFSSKC